MSDDRIPYRRMVQAMKAYADDLGDGAFSLAFELETENGLTVVLDRPTLERLQIQIAHALKPQDGHAEKK